MGIVSYCFAQVITLNNEEVFRIPWSPNLLGRPEFQIGKTKAHIQIKTETTSSAYYEYILHVNGKPLEKFTKERARACAVWKCLLRNGWSRIVLEKDSLDVWVNGEKVETFGEFVDGGSEHHFEVDSHVCVISTVSSGHYRKGVVHSLCIDGKELQQTVEGD